MKEKIVKKTEEKSLEEKCSWGFTLACPNLPKPCTKRCSFYLDIDDYISEDEIFRRYQEIKNYIGWVHNFHKRNHLLLNTLYKIVHNF